MPISDQSVADAISKKISKTIEVKTPTFEDAVAKTLAYLFNDIDKAAASGVYAIRDRESRNAASGGEMRRNITRNEAARLCLFYNHKGLIGNASVLRWLLDRELTSVEEWVDSQLDRARQV